MQPLYAATHSDVFQAFGQVRKVAPNQSEFLSESLNAGEGISCAHTLLTKGQGLTNGYAYSPQIHALLGQISAEAFSDYRHTHVRLHRDIGAGTRKATQGGPFRCQRTGVQYQR
jgi:hypothetical protein